MTYRECYEQGCRTLQAAGIEEATLDARLLLEAVFDWKKYLQDTFGYEVDESWMKDDASAEPED